MGNTGGVTSIIIALHTRIRFLTCFAMQQSCSAVCRSNSGQSCQNKTAEVKLTKAESKILWLDFLTLATSSQRYSEKIPGTTESRYSPFSEIHRHLSPQWAKPQLHSNIAFPPISSSSYPASPAGNLELFCRPAACSVRQRASHRKLQRRTGIEGWEWQRIQGVQSSFCVHGSIQSKYRRWSMWESWF